MKTTSDINIFASSSGHCSLDCPYCIVQRSAKNKPSLNIEDIKYIINKFDKKTLFGFSGRGDFFESYQYADRLLTRILEENTEVILDINGVFIQEFEEIPDHLLSKIIDINLTMHYQQIKTKKLLDQWKKNALIIIDRKAKDSLMVGTILSPLVKKWWREGLVWYEKEIFSVTQFKIELIRDVDLKFTEEDEADLRLLEKEFSHIIRNVYYTDYSLPFKENNKVLCPAGNSYFRIWNDGRVEGCPYQEPLSDMGNIKDKSFVHNESKFICNSPGYNDCVRIFEHDKMIFLPKEAKEVEKENEDKNKLAVELNSVRKGKTLVLAPHPDDEVFGCGGAIIKHVQQNDPLKVVIVTDGGFAVIDEQKTEDYSELRKSESRKAAKVLGSDEPIFLDYPDQKLEVSEKTIQHVLDLIKDFQAENIYIPAETETHTDHIALTQIAIEAIKRYEPNVHIIYYEIGQTQTANSFLNISPFYNQLNEAIDAFESQMQALDYKRHVNALQVLRAYGLGEEVEYAEAYHCIQSKNIKTGQQLWNQKRKSINLVRENEINAIEFPLISIIIRTMNRPELSNALESISKQTYPNIEVIIVNASGDSSLELSEQCGVFPMRNISLEEQLPRAEAANAGLKEVNGAYFCFLDEDDTLLPSHVNSLFFKIKNTGSIAAYSDIKKISNQKEIILNQDFNFYRLHWENFLPIHAVLIDKKAIDHKCAFDTQFEIYEDWDFMLQIAQFGDFIHLNELTGIYNDTNSSGSSGDTEKIKKYRTAVLDKWKVKFSDEEYRKYLDFVSNIYLEEKEYFKALYFKEKLGLKDKVKEGDFPNEIFEPIEVFREEKVGQVEQVQKEPIEPQSDEEVHEANVFLMSKSDLFDSEYYLNTYPDVKLAGLNPAVHYYYNGWHEGRNPSNEFNTVYYLAANVDVRKANTNPLIHYEKYGRLEKRLPKPVVLNESGYKKKANICDVTIDHPISSNAKVAIVFHLYFTDLLDEFISYFQNIGIPYDLFITTSKDVEPIEKIFAEKLPHVKTTIHSFENKGRDISPFLNVLKKDLMGYDYVCKVHTKKSNHDIKLLHWRKHLLDHTIGNTQIVQKIISEFETDKKLGLVWPISFPYLSFLGLDNNWGAPLYSEQNYTSAKTYFPEFKLDGINIPIVFPQGSMFWFRPKALEILTQKNFDKSIFEEEKQQIDGTLAHTFERIFGLIAQKSGYETKTTFFPKAILNNKEKPFRNLSGAKSILFIAHDLYRAGAEKALLQTLQWLQKHTAFKLNVLALKLGDDQGKLLPDYEKCSNVYLWKDFLINQTEDEAIKELKNELGEIDLIYGNTIVSANIYPLLRSFNAPFISHIHELEESIKRYTSEEVRKSWKEFSSIHIACSTQVKENLKLNHGILDDDIACVHEFIHPTNPNLAHKSMQRKKLGLAKGKTIIWGCGTIYWRKGPDVFIQTAKKLKDQGINDFVFYWIGENLWNLEREEWGDWQKWEDYIIENDLQDHVQFLGEKENPKDYFSCGDIFYLPSREDPFPLVALEAAECALPIIGFSDAGGIPDFIGDDAGEIIPFLDIDHAASAIGEFILNEESRITKGQYARKKVLQKHTDEIAVPQILQLIHQSMKSNPLVSIIVPVYNHAKFLIERLDSILAQSFKDFEIIILDDASTDSSFEIAKSYESHPAIRVIKNDQNSKSPFKQWKKGVEQAKGKYIWIAEGDDKAEPEFLELLLPKLQDADVSLAYCASHRIDENAKVYNKHYLNIGHYDSLAFPKEKWEEDYVESGKAEIENALAIRNTIPNVSAVLFNGDKLREVDFEKSATFKTAGDWFVYTSLLREGKIAYKSEHLNFHRVHENSVVAMSKLKAEDTIPDYFKMHQLIIKEFAMDEAKIQMMIKSVQSTIKSIWPELSNEDYTKLYNQDLLIDLEKNRKADA